MHRDSGAPRQTEKEEGTWVTGTTQAFVFAGSANQTFQGDGRADRLLVSISAPIATTTGISLSLQSSSGPVLTVLTGFVRAMVLRYEEYGDAIRGPITLANVTTAVTVFITPVYWRAKRDD